MARKPFATVGIVTAFVAAPALLTLTYATLSDNDALRPLSSSVQAVRANLFGGSDVVHAMVTVGAGGLSDDHKVELASQIENAFGRRNVPVDVTFRTHADKATPTISYHVGSAEVGPLSLRDASKGVRAAVEAYRLHR